MLRCRTYSTAHELRRKIGENRISETERCVPWENYGFKSCVRGISNLVSDRIWACIVLGSRGDNHHYFQTTTFQFVVPGTVHYPDYRAALYQTGRYFSKQICSCIASSAMQIDISW